MIPLGIFASGISGNLGPPFDLTYVRGWYDASDTTSISVSGNAVTQWNDKSTYGKNLIQNTGAARPTSGVTTLNSKNVVTFDGGDFLGVASGTESDWTFLTDGTDYLVCFVAKFGDVANPDTYMGLINTKSSATTTGMDFYSDYRVSRSRMSHIVYNASEAQIVNNDSGNVFTANDWLYGSLFADPNNGTAANRSKIYYETGSAATNNTLSGTVSGVAPLRGLELGRYSNDFGHLVGGVAELIIFYGAGATETNRGIVNTYLASKWGL
jgi:hypothetical protein